MPYELQFRPLIPYVPFFLRGLLVTLEVTFLALLVGTVFGVILAAMRLSRWRLVSWLARVIVDLVRGIPALVLLVYLYYGVSMLLGLDIPALISGVIGLGLYYGAYMSETFRAGIQAIDSGEIEAAYSLGMGSFTVFHRVILPQAFRIVLPPFANNFVSMLKDSSLVSVLAVSELMREGQQVMIATFRAFEVFTVVALIYYVLTAILSALVNQLERRLRAE